jgi:WD40 repeat protein
MTKRALARTFISYSRKDGAEFAAHLRSGLEAEGFTIWQDLIALEGGRDWWSQIEAALKSKPLQHFILVVTPQALASPVVRREIRLARQEGKTFLPIKGPGLGDLNALPRWIGQLADLDISEHRATLRRILEAPSTATRVPMMAPEPPHDFVPRLREFEALKQQLLDGKDDAVAITAALRGAGGYGKTTLAKALAHDSDIADAFFDGILWVELGEQGGARLLTVINDLVALLAGTSSHTATLEAARTALAEALGDLRILLVIDDVWQRSHLDPFLHGGRHTARLLTTRFDRELPDTAVRQKVDAMQPGEALALLSAGLPEDQARVCGRELANLAIRLHEWAQLLKLANGFLRDRAVKFRQPLAAAIVEAGRRLAARGLPAFDDPKAENYEMRHKSVAAAIGLNLDLLDADRRGHFGELGIFPEDADVPIGIVARLWRETGGLGEFEAIDLLSELHDLSLLLDLDLDRRTLRLHDTTRHFLQDEARKAGRLATQHSRLVAAVGGLGEAPDAEARETDYFYRYLPEHLHEAGDRVALDAKLLDPGWLKAKLAATASPLGLVADYENFGHGEVQSLIGRTLRLTAGICARDPRQLMPQLLGRLMASKKPSAASFISAAQGHLATPTLITARPSLMPPGAEITRLEGHAGWVEALVPLPDGQLASGGRDGTIRLWDLNTGREGHRLEGHASWVTALVMLPDGRLASGGEDRAILLWDPSASTEMTRLEAPARISALAVLPNGRLASGGADGTIHLWDLNKNAEIGLLKGHDHEVLALLLLADDQLVSGGRDGTIRFWDLKTNTETACLKSGPVASLALLPDGRLASSGWPGAILLWDISAGAETASLAGHLGCWVQALAVVPGGRLASGGGDNKIRLWEPKDCAEVAQLEGHSQWVRALAMLPDGRLASCGDNTIRLWDLTDEIETAHPDGPMAEVDALVLLPNGYLASGGHDSMIRLWDPDTGTESARFEGHTDHVKAIALLPDGHLASGGRDGTVILWDLKSGLDTARFPVDRAWVGALELLPDGRLATAGWEGTIRLWDLKSGAELGRLNAQHPVESLLLLPDGRLASGGWDGTIRLWDLNANTTSDLLRAGAWVKSLAILPNGYLASGGFNGMIRLWDLTTSKEMARLEGHVGLVNAIAVLPDGRLTSGGSDNTIRLWDTKNCSETMRLEVDGHVNCLVALPNGRLVAGDAIGRMHWLIILE